MGRGRVADAVPNLRRALLGLLSVATVGIATACSVTDDQVGRLRSDGGHEPSAQLVTPTSAATPAPPAADATIAAAEPVTIAFAGDIHFEGGLRGRLDDPATALGPIAETLRAADLAVVNLESAVGDGGDREPKRFTFQAPTSAFSALAAAGADVVTMANNHAGDFGFDNVESVLAAAGDTDPPLAVVGIGSDAEAAFTPAFIDAGGTTVAVLGASAADHDPTADPTGRWAATADRAGIADAIDPTALLTAIEGADEQADVVVVYVHWGVQGRSCPSDEQTQLAALVSDAGADIVVGSHAHRLQGAGMLGKTYVAYGLGNFAWYTQSPETSATGVLTVTVEDGRVADDDWQPARIGSSGLPEVTTGAEAERMTQEFRDLRGCTDLGPPP